MRPGPILGGGGGTLSVHDVLGRPKTIIDYDGDGWCDLWSWLFKEITHRDRRIDTDADGMTDYEEMVLFLSPLTPDPWPKSGGNPPQEAGPPGNMFSITFATEIGRPHLAQSSLELENWATFEDWFLADSSEFTLTDTNAVEDQKFYRLAPSAIRPGFDEFELPSNDDDSTTDPVPFGFEIHFFGIPHEECYVNNNGNITFTDPWQGRFPPSWDPHPMTQFHLPIIAPFWADVDTSMASVNNVRYGPGQVMGRPAFGVNYLEVGYFDDHDDPLNSFQLVLIDRSDIAPGDFDIEFNYEQLLWEAGDVSGPGGTNGLGGLAAGVGAGDGNGNGFEHLLSRVNSKMLDFLNPPDMEDLNLSDGLIYNSWNSPAPGRLVTEFRGGFPANMPIADAGPDQVLTVFEDGYWTDLDGEASFPGGGAISVLWTLVERPSEFNPFLNPIQDPDQLDTEVRFHHSTFKAGDYVFELRVWAENDPFYTADRVTLTWTLN